MSGIVRTRDAAQRLGVSTRQVRKLVAAGVIKEAARGVLDATSVDRYAAIDRTGTKAWAPETAWAAVALLAGLDAPWLGRDQTARLRRRLRDVTPEQLVERTRDRATVTRYSAHRSVLPRISAQLARPRREALGLAATIDDSADGYLAAASLDRIVRANALKEDPDGNLTLRTTAVGIDVIADLVATDALAALDLAASLDTRERHAALTHLRDALQRWRS
ncbi:type IV toxin-antitoxin system AbiEi family antitoxin domain-containing protein [Cellulomonas sp. Y8]|uniref:type IV toxin-antitoxin system AbiEi family antitoxin domain-containing protein n=1 Tax=Cellulomonas sp. Y8 TaxID=2591145 RepID=UPI003D70355A